MKSFLHIIFILLLFAPVPAKMVTVLSEVYNPGSIDVDKDHIYIVQEATIYIYSIDNFRLIKKFGKRGEGPREFLLSDDNMVFLSVQPDHLMVNSVGRITYFKKNGEYINERLNSAGLWMEPLGKNFVGMKRIYDETNTRHRKLFLFNEKLESLKIIYEEIDGIQPIIKVIEAVTWPSGIYKLYDKKIFVTDKEKTIYVYDQTGKKLNEINLPFKRIKVDSEVREKYLKFYREEDPYWRKRWERLKNWFKFPEYLPVVLNFLVKDDTIYILTHHQQNGMSEFLILDLSGKLKKRKMIPIIRGDWSIFNVSPFDIKNNKIYQLAENPDTEENELHIFDLN